MHGTGNDFIITGIDSVTSESFDAAILSKMICNRHFGVGADGFMFYMESDIADIKMLYYNSDGTKAEMCGNGIRCFARYVYEKGKVENTEFTIETDAGVYTVAIEEKCLVEVEMGLPISDACSVPVIGGRSEKFFKEEIETQYGKIEVSAVRMGVPHTVVFEVPNQTHDVEKWGSEIEKLKKVFPEGTNVNFVKILSENKIAVETWERGAGKTLSCGTGVCASAYLAHIFGYVGGKVDVKVPGGSLTIGIKENSLYMKGEAILICDGDFHLEKCDL